MCIRFECVLGTRECGVSKLCRDPTVQSEFFLRGSLFKTLGVRSLANASRARQFNPQNPPGVGWVPLPQTNMAAVIGRARSCVRGRGARSYVRGRSCVVARARSVIRGRARSVVPFCPLRDQHCRGTNERTNNI